MKTSTFDVKGMHCKSCVIVIEGALTDTEGVQDANVNFEAQRATVNFDETMMDDETIRQIIRDNGYEVA